MSIKNLMEDIVGNLVDQVLTSEKELLPADCKVSPDDITAFVLNRITPKYITSERGILHGKIDVKLETQNKTDIYLLVYEAINIIKNRRDSEISTQIEKDESELSSLIHIVGEVLEETTFSKVPDVEVSLLFNDELANMVDPNWKNPYVINSATRGYYHFWPEYEEKSMGNDKVPFKLIFRHPQFVERSLDFELSLIEREDLYRSYVVPIVLLKIKDGADPAFLYVSDKSD